MSKGAPRFIEIKFLTNRFSQNERRRADLQCCFRLFNFAQDLVMILQSLVIILLNCTPFSTLKDHN